MRVITGIAGGRRLAALEGIATRPTGDKVKEGIFSAIQFDIEGRKVIDLFAGSGQLGIEALSRGAEFALFCDNNDDAVKIIRANLAATGFTDVSQVSVCSYGELLASTPYKFDIAFLDPPYHAGLLPRAAEDVAKVMAPHGIIICEHDEKTQMPETVGGFALKKRYRYGKTAVSLYRGVINE